MTRTFTLLVAVLVAAFAFVFTACGDDPSTHTPVTDTGANDTGGDTDPGDTTEQPLEATLEVNLVNVVADGNLEFAVFEDGSMDVAWMKVMEESYSTVIPVTVGDVCVIRLRYDDDFEYELTVDIDEEYVVEQIDVTEALPCIEYVDVEDYAWTCSDTNIENHDGFSVEMEDGHCVLRADGFMNGGELDEDWIYHGPGHLSTITCDQPWCQLECTGTPINE